ncbi:transposase [Leptothoe spongobia]|uniref:Transposase n=1 Tax=Leptothoe spongobia TAU-MAC 1115 TaxID=1967444 RepID=A0A947DDV5_9CYAN|nr:transposase [Leptothoe spongobia TAU-MAC 1115]
MGFDLAINPRPSGYRSSSRSQRLTSIDSQSVRTSEKKGPDPGIDGHKWVKGRKRHIVVDILGLVLNCFVSAANVVVIKAAVVVLDPLLEAYVRIEKVLLTRCIKAG